MSGLQLVTLADRKAVYALLDRMLDWLPQSGVSVQRDPSSKPGVGSWRRCNRCAGSGRVTGIGKAARACRGNHGPDAPGHGCRPCLNCEAGWVKATRGQEGSSRMLSEGEHELAEEAMTKSERRRWIDTQILNLQAMAAVRAGEAALPDQVLRAISRKQVLYSQGSFGALDVALLQLAFAYPLRHDAIRLYLIDQHAQPAPMVAVRLAETVGWLAERMPRPIRLPHDADQELAAWKHSLEHGRTPAHRDQRDQRNAEIRALRDEHGWAVAKLGAEYNLSRTAVYAILETAVASAPAA